MKKTRIDAVEMPPTNSPADVVRPLSAVLETESVALNYFELAPTESFGYAYHRHLDQEEVFYTAVHPPSTERTLPVTNEAASLAR
jgi:hypothetical protein